MREATSLTAANPPARVPVFVPGCGAQVGKESDGSACGLEGFEAAVRRSIDPAYLSTQQ
jgi:hypothetical protein